VKQQVKIWAGAVALSAVVGLGSSYTAQAGPFDGVLGKVVKVGGIAFLVKQFGPQINKAINTLLQQKGVRYDGKTKVVPTFALGSGAYIGGAQIQGEPEQVDQVKYVATVEVPLGRVRGKAYFPVKSLIKGNSITKPVKGTGVTAIVDFKI
jgi:hypothetical protein